MSKTVNTERESPKFIAGFDAVAITVVQDLLTLVAPSDKCLLIHEVNITTEETVAEKLKLELKVGEGNTVGSVGSTPTPVNLIKGYGTVAADVRANDTTQAIAGAGSLTTLLTQYFDIVTGGLYKPPANRLILVKPDDEFIAALETAPAGSIAVSGYIVWEEVLLTSFQGNVGA